MDKKASIFHWVIFVIVAALSIVVLVTYSAGDVFKGEGQVYYSHTAKEAEKFNLFLSAASRSIIDDFLVQRAINGGFKAPSAGMSGETECGSVNEINLWNKLEGDNEEKICLPAIKDELNEEFKEKIGSYISLYPMNEQVSETFSFVRQPTYDYSLIIEENRIKGTAKTPAIFRVIKKGQVQSEYHFYPAFSFNLGYNPEEYFKLWEEAQGLKETCSSASDFKQCLIENKPGDWKVGACQGEFIHQENGWAFCVNRGITYQFAVDFG